eukprot:5885640-Pyramimonas_sp.AAC.1
MYVCGVGATVHARRGRQTRDTSFAVVVSSIRFHDDIARVSRGSRRGRTGASNTSLDHVRGLFARCKALMVNEYCVNSSK